MPRTSSPRLLLLLPTTTYRTAAFVEAARRLGVALTVASDQPSTFESSQPAGLLTLDFAHLDRAAEQAAVFAREHPIAGVVGVDDDTAVLAAVIVERLSAAGELKGNPVTAALAARDKHRQRVLLAEHGVPAPAFELHALEEDPAGLAHRVRYPCVLKPLRLSASRGVMRADDATGFVSAFRRLKAILEQPDVAACGEPARHFLVEDFVPGVEVALEGLVADGCLRVLALFDKPDPLDGPFFEETIYVTPSRLPERAERAIAACAQAAVTALGIMEGPVHAELRHNDRGAWLIELAARPIGGRCGAVLRFETRVEREQRAAGVMMIPVPGPGGGVLREVRGVAEARAVPLVEDVAITAHRGQTLVPWPEGSRYPGFIFARGETPEAVEAALRMAHRRLQFVTE